MFKFKLQPVLKYRKRIEEKFQTELGKIKKRFYEEKRRLNLLFKNKEDFQKEINLKYKKGITLSEIILYSHFICIVVSIDARMIVMYIR